MIASTIGSFDCPISSHCQEFHSLLHTLKYLFDSKFVLHRFTKTPLPGLRSPPTNHSPFPYLTSTLSLQINTHSNHV